MATCFFLGILFHGDGEYFGLVMGTFQFFVRIGEVTDDSSVMIMMLIHDFFETDSWNARLRQVFII